MRPHLERLEADYAPGTLSLFRRATRYVWPYRRRFAVKFGLSVLSLLPTLIVAWPVKIIVDHVVLGTPVGEQPTPYPFFVAFLVEPLMGETGWAVLAPMLALQAGLMFLIGAIGTSSGEIDRTDANLASGRDSATRSENQANAGGSSASGLLGLIEFFWTIRLTHLLNHHYRSALFSRLQRLPMTAFDEERIGDSVYRVMYDTPAITDVCYRLLISPAVAVLAILLIAVGIQLTYPIHTGIALAALAGLPIAFLATLPWTARLRRSHVSAREAGATTTSTVEEGMNNILAVQSLGGEEREQTRFSSDSWESFGRYRRVVLTILLATFSGAVPGALVVAWVFVYVTNLIIAGQLSPGDFGLLVVYLSQVARHSIRIGTTWIDMQNSASGLGRVFFLMDLPGDEEQGGERALPRIREGIRLESVSHTYDDGTEALRGVDLEIRIGELTALVGPTGAGKTTLAYTIPRYIVPEGRITADGVDLATVSLDSIRSQTAFVFQETSLFDESVAENIRLGRPDATETEVRRAARLAGADEFVRSLPAGYDTRLGRGGGKLSVGQKQRLAIARALVRDPPVLILDEPTSALDPETERRLVASLRGMRRGRAVVVIAHRLSTIREADQIVFLERGRVIERGTHQELVARLDGAYRRYVELQTLGAA